MHGLHHLHAHRHPDFKKGKLLGWKSHKLSVRVFERVMYTVAILSPLALAPQIFDIFITHNVSGLVLSTWAMLFGINILWIIYSLIHKAVPVLIANILFSLFNLAGVIGILLYR